MDLLVFISSRSQTMPLGRVDYICTWTDLHKEACQLSMTPSPQIKLVLMSTAGVNGGDKGNGPFWDISRDALGMATSLSICRSFEQPL